MYWRVYKNTLIRYHEHDMYDKNAIDRDRKLYVLRHDSHLSAMKTRYDSNGGALQLCAQSKKALRLDEPSRWRLDNLVKAQPNVLRPLLNYWSVPVYISLATSTRTVKNKEKKSND